MEGKFFFETCTSWYLDRFIIHNANVRNSKSYKKWSFWTFLGKHVIDIRGGLDQLAKLVPAPGEQLCPLEAGHALQDNVLVRSAITLPQKE